MCLILLALQQHSSYRLILAANRDEYYDRPSAPPAFGVSSGPACWKGSQIRGNVAWDYEEGAHRCHHKLSRPRLHQEECTFQRMVG
jgi:regulator of replication initiation timing